MNKKIFLVEDDLNIGYLMSQHLINKGYQVELCDNGEDAINTFISSSPSICLLDIMLPVKDGFDLAKEIRKIDSNIPILFITAKSQLKDVIKGFESGGNDFIKKPFSLEELVLRIESFLNLTTNKSKDEESFYNIGEYQFDYNQGCLIFKDDIKYLSKKEIELLKMLCDHVNDRLKKSEALIKIWGNDTFYNGRSMDVYISKIRKLLSKDPNIEIINLRGIGYKLIINKSMIH